LRLCGRFFALTGKCSTVLQSANSDRQYKRPESVLVVVYTRAGLVLLLRRADHPEFWQSVTGSMEWGDEQPAETAARELREETGIDVTPAALTDRRIQQRYVLFPQWRHKYAPDVSENTEHFFSLELPDVVPVSLSPAEHGEYAWVPFAEAVERVFSWTNRDALLLVMQERAARPAARGA
jgi:dATP pyrophosphohydrolase